VAKFHGDRPRDLGDYALEKKKHHEHFISPPVTPYGRPNNDICLRGSSLLPHTVDCDYALCSTRTL